MGSQDGNTRSGRGSGRRAHSGSVRGRWRFNIHQPITRRADYRSEIISGHIPAQYARAREEQADFYADEIVTIADTEPDAATARVRVDARKWVASKLKPKRYGDKLALGGADDLPAIRQEVQERADAFTKAIAGMVDRGKAGKGETKH